MMLVSLLLHSFTATHAFVVRDDVVRDDDAAADSSAVRMRDEEIAAVVADQEDAGPGGDAAGGGESPGTVEARAHSRTRDREALAHFLQQERNVEDLVDALGF